MLSRKNNHRYSLFTWKSRLHWKDVCPDNLLVKKTRNDWSEDKKKSDVEIPDNKKHIPSFLEGTPSYVISKVWKAPCLPRELQSCMCGFCLQIFMCRLCCLLCRCDHQYIFFNITWERALWNGQSLTHFSLESSTIYVPPQSVINTDWRWRKRLPKHFDQ